MADYPKLCFKIALVGIAVALLTAIFVAVSPMLIGESQLNQNLLPVAAMLIIILACIAVLFGSLIGSLLVLYEIITAKNDSQWKAIWIVVIFILGIIGVGLYLSLARKERK